MQVTACEPVEQAQQRRLAGSGRPHDGAHALGQPEIQAVEHRAPGAHDGDVLKSEERHAR